MLPVQFVHFVELNSGAAVPEGHDKHIAEPSSEYSPGLQGTHKCEP